MQENKSELVRPVRPRIITPRLLQDPGKAKYMLKAETFVRLSLLVSTRNDAVGKTSVMPRQGHHIKLEVWVTQYSGRHYTVPKNATRNSRCGAPCLRVPRNSRPANAC